LYTSAEGNQKFFLNARVIEKEYRVCRKPVHRKVGLSVKQILRRKLSSAFNLQYQDIWAGHQGWFVLLLNRIDTGA
jgi:hypothetical protein